MMTLASGLSYIDLQFQGVPRVIATVVLHGKGGVALIDPGPASTLPVLRGELERAGIAIADLTTLLLTHIHLDHAGATGTLVRENPRLRVYVHERGAPHMIDPAKLLASATRLYGDAMDRLWGEFRPVPPDAITVLTGHERISEAGRDLEIAYTPGHASHHVSYFDRAAGVAFVGDTAGIRVRPGGFVLPPTPPPDIDLDAWRDSLRRIDQWGPDTLFLTHFGPSAPVAAHLRELDDHLELAARLVKSSLAMDGDDAAREAWFAGEVKRELRRQMSEADAMAYEVAGRFDLNWRGLARYWRKKGDEELGMRN
jgi:glyoxylase-like metal-dependent hydrolase (beta-lactamase superfamily II)